MEVNKVILECVLNREKQNKLREQLCPQNTHVEKAINTTPSTAAEVSHIQIFGGQQYFCEN